jgi:hypothetical protein
MNGSAESIDSPSECVSVCENYGFNIGQNLCTTNNQSGTGFFELAFCWQYQDSELNVYADCYDSPKYECY